MPIELGKGIADTNSVPGLKHRSFYAVLDRDGNTVRRVSIDAENNEIIIEDSSQAVATWIGRIADSDATVELEGAGGNIYCRTSLCNGKTLQPMEFPVCVDGELKKAMFIMSAPY